MTNIYITTVIYRLLLSLNMTFVVSDVILYLYTYHAQRLLRIQIGQMSQKYAKYYCQDYFVHS